MKNPHPTPKKTFKKRYNRLNQSHYELLLNFYRKKAYPSLKEMRELAEGIHSTVMQVENWFKHRRKLDVTSGLMKYEKKKVFTSEENCELEKEFEKNSKPSLEEYQTLAEKFHCKTKNLKNWFSYRRKLKLRGQNLVQPPSPSTNNTQIEVKIENSNENEQRNFNLNPQRGNTTENGVFGWYLECLAQYNYSLRMNQMLTSMMGLNSKFYCYY